MKSLRILFYTISLFIIVIVFMLGSLMFFIDPNKMKPIIAEEIKKRTGYQLIMEGKLSWSFYPVGIHIERMSLQAPNQTIPFIELKNVAIGMSLSQWLQGSKKLDSDVYIGDINLMKLKLKDVHVSLHRQNEVITLNPIVASFYEGTLKGVINGRELTTLMRWDWELEATHFQLKPLLDDLNTPSSQIKLSGKGQLKLKGLTQGKNQEDIFRYLNGIVEFSIHQGVIEGIDFNYYLKAADAYLDKRVIPEPATISQTAFDSLTGVMDINHGIAQTVNLMLVSPEFAAKGEGSIDLMHENIDYRLQVTPMQLSRLKWMVPVLIEGNLTAPTIRLDVLTLKTIMATEQFEKAKVKLQEEAGKLPNKLENLFQKVLTQ